MNNIEQIYNIKKPFFALAPMAGISTYPFASQCADFGADLVWSPMIHTNALIHNPKDSLNIINLGCHSERREGSGSDSSPLSQNDKSKPCVVKYIIQLVGSEPDNFAKATKIINNKLNPVGIDINIGCPDKSILKSGCGGALMQNPDLIIDIVKAVKSETKLPVSVKTRAGFEKANEIFTILPKLTTSGIDMLTIHPRTVKQGYKGKADWDIIKQISKIRDHLPILVGSGDIKSWQEALDKQKETKCDGVLIGRGSLGKPWIFKEIKDKKEYETSLDEIKELTLDIAIKADDLWGERGIQESKKHFAWYFREFPGAQEYRKKLMLANTLDDVKNVINTF